MENGNMGKYIPAPADWKDFLNKHGPWAFFAVVSMWGIYQFVLVPSQLDRDLVRDSIKPALEQVAEAVVSLDSRLEKVDSSIQQGNVIAQDNGKKVEEGNQYLKEVKDCHDGQNKKLDVIIGNTSP